jgi:hypothetical protein
MEAKSGNKTVPTKKAMQKLRDKLKAKSNRPSKDDRDSDTEMPASPMYEFGPPPTITSTPPLINSLNSTGSPPLIHSNLPHAPNYSNYPSHSQSNPTAASGTMSAASSPSANANTMNTLGSPSVYSSNMVPLGTPPAITTTSNSVGTSSGIPLAPLGSSIRKFSAMTLPRKSVIQRAESLEDSEPFNKDFFLVDKKESAVSSPNTSSSSFPSPKRGRSLSSAANIERPIGISGLADQSPAVEKPAHIHPIGANPPHIGGSTDRMLGGKHTGPQLGYKSGSLKVETNPEYTASPLSTEIGETPLTAYRQPIDLKEDDTEGLLKKIEKGNQRATAAHDDAYEAFTRLENNFGKLNTSLTSLISVAEESLNTVLGCYAPINEESSEIKSTLMTLKEGQERLTKEMTQVHEALESEAQLVDTGFAQVNELSQAYRQTVILSSKPSKTKEIFWVIVSWILSFLAIVVWIVISLTRLIRSAVPPFISKPIAVWSRTSPWVTPSNSTLVINSSSSSSSSTMPANNSNFSMPTNPEAWRKRLRAYFDEKNSLASTSSSN